jgi:hypothetical protein
MVKYIKGKNGKFAGSIGDGKNRIPQSMTIPSIEDDSLDDFTVRMGLNNYFEAFVTSNQKIPTMNEGQKLLSSMAEHGSDVPNDLESWFEHFGNDGSDQQVWESNAKSIATVRQDLAIARLHLNSALSEKTLSPEEIEHSYNTALQRRGKTVMNLVANLNKKMGTTTPQQQFEDETLDALHSVSEIMASPEYLRGIDNIESLDNNEKAHFSVLISEARLICRQVEESSYPDSKGYLSLPTGVNPLISATALQEEISETQRTLNKCSAREINGSNENLTNALTRIKNAHSAHYQLAWEN